MIPSGLILIDKKAGITSMATDSFVKRLLATKKVGHHGTLDPFATGLLPVYVGPSLKYVRYADDFDKKYICVARFGARTDTLDKEGEVISGHYPSAEELKELVDTDFKVIREAFSSMTSITSQMPPKYSAKKINGKKAYELAREGKEVELKPHKVKIYSVDILGINLVDNTFEVEFEVFCSKGTYIRTICDDVGEMTGFGAHAKSLRRIMCGCFSVEDAYTEEQLTDMASGEDYSFIRDARETLSFMPELILDKKQNDDVRVGRKISSKPFNNVLADYPEDQKYRATYQGELVAVLYKSVEENGREIMRIERMLA